MATPEDVDAIFERIFGASQGPFRLMDMVDLDVVLDIEEHYAAERTGIPEGPRKLLREYIAKGGWAGNREQVFTTTSHDFTQPRTIMANLLAKCQLSSDGLNCRSWPPAAVGRCPEPVFRV